MNPPSILEQIAKHAPTNFLILLRESEGRLIASWLAAIGEAARQDTKPKLKVSLSVDVNPDEGRIEYRITFGARHKSSIEEPFDDPNQPELPITPE